MECLDKVAVFKDGATAISEAVIFDNGEAMVVKIPIDSGISAH